jgi:hypothetical protein
MKEVSWNVVLKDKTAFLADDLTLNFGPTPHTLLRTYAKSPAAPYVMHVQAKCNIAT